MSPNGLRWEGGPGHYEVWYLIVSGRFWFRYTIHVPSDQALGGEAALWLVSFAGTPSARKQVFPLDAFRAADGRWPVELGPGLLGDFDARGAVDGASWELRLERLAPPLDPLPALLRPFPTSRLVLSAPALEVSGRVEVDGVRHELERAPGHQAHVWGSRHADRFGWAHAAQAGGGWVGLLTAKARRLPEVSLVATPGRRSLARAELSPERWRIGRFTIEASPDSFVGVTYRDPHGTPLYCYHTESGRLRGPGVETDVAAFEYATRAKLPGWPISL